MEKIGKYNGLEFKVKAINKRRLEVKYIRRKVTYSFTSYNILAYYLLDSDNKILRTESCRQFYTEIRRNIKVIEELKELDNFNYA